MTTTFHRHWRDVPEAAILPLVPYLGTLRWEFIAIALAGIAVARHDHRVFGAV